MSKHVLLEKEWNEHQREITELRNEVERLRIVVKYFQQEGGQPARDIIKNLMKEG